MEFYNYNGKLYRQDENIISVNSRGLRFGDGLFETMKANTNEIYFAADHFDRLLNGLAVLQFKIPAHFTTEKLKQQVLNLLKKNEHQKMARIRFTVFRRDGGLYDEVDPAPDYLIQTWPVPETAGQWNSNGLVLGVYSDVRKSCDILSNLKHNNFLPYVMAAMHSKRQKWNDAVVLNTHGRLCDTTIANIFIVKADKIYTPSLDEGCIAGVMRKNIISHLAANNVVVTEIALTENDLLQADEVFLTNSIYNLRWVQSIAEKSYRNGFTQKIYSLLSQTIL